MSRIRNTGSKMTCFVTLFDPLCLTSHALYRIAQQFIHFLQHFQGFCAILLLGWWLCKESNFTMLYIHNCCDWTSPCFSARSCVTCVIPAFRLSSFACLKGPFFAEMCIHKESGIAICGSGMIYFGSPHHTFWAIPDPKSRILPLINTGLRKVTKFLLSVLNRAEVRLFF